MKAPIPARRGQYHSLVIIFVHGESGEAAARPFTMLYPDGATTDASERDALDHYATHPELVPEGFALTGAYVTHTWEVK